MTQTAPTSPLVPLSHASLAEVERAELSRPMELELQPVDGLPRWLGRRLAAFFMRFVSMEEQAPQELAQMVTSRAGYFRRDRHVHPTVDPTTYRLAIDGVAEDRTLDLAGLRALPFEERVCVQECAGNGNHIMGSAGLCGQAIWRGPTFDSVLEACGGPGDATHFAFHGLDRIPLLKPGYHYGLSLAELREAGAILALEMNGEPLTRRHGFPARLVVPKIYSMSHVKWLARIEGKTSPHRGIHNRLVFTNKELRDGRWVRVQARWIGLKSVINRCSRDRDGWLLSGCAWGGKSPITKVEVSTDGGVTWEPAELLTPEAHFAATGTALAGDALGGAWAIFHYRWRATPGVHRVASRAINADGELQVLEEDPGVRGHFNQTRVKWRRVVVPTV